MIKYFILRLFGGTNIANIFINLIKCKKAWYAQNSRLSF